MKSTIEDLGAVKLPSFTGIRVMMMPFLLDDVETVPFLNWREPIAAMLGHAGAGGVGYLTIDEARVAASETHRRPGLHVDGVGGWGGPNPAPYAARGMIVAASEVGCRAWPGYFEGEPGDDGDCEHMREQIDGRASIFMRPNRAYWCNPTALHEALPMTMETERTFVRLSMPSDAPWHEGYSPNPYGIKPTGPILPRRAEQMGYRP